MNKLNAFVVLNVLVIAAVKVQAYNILAIFPLDFKSHYIIHDSILTELAKRGHNVTVINSFPKTKPIKNFRDVDVSACFKHPVELFVLEKAVTFKTPWNQLPEFFYQVRDYEAIFTCKPMIEFMKSVTETSYDLIITEPFNADTLLVYTKHFTAPFMLFCAGTIYPWVADRMGNPFNPSYTSYTHTDVPITAHPSFNERLYNTLVYTYASLLFYYTSYTTSDGYVRKYLGNDVPPLTEIAKNTSLVLSFSHFSLNRPMPLLPNIIEISGVQIVEPKPLPKDIEKFINESEHGVIYFCLGSLLRTETMPEEKRTAFLNAFAKLPQRVLWKWGDDILPGKTDKIFISKWMPQRDILAHPKVKLFISHGGALGINEAVYEGVPVLGIPMYADQTVNLKTLEWYGAAEILEYTDINNDTVLSKLQLLLNNDKYSKNMKKVSDIFRDRPMKPLDTAVYWVEYVIRHKGAPHLRSAAADMPLYQYLLLDVIAFILLVFISIVMIIYYSLRAFYRLICGSKSKNKPVKGKSESKKKK